MQAAFQIDGVDDLRRDLRRVKDSGLNDALKAANKALADDVVRRALPKVPVRSGRLKSSVRGLGNLSGAVGKAGGAAVPYAAVVHWRKGGRPFLREAAREIEPQAAGRYLDEVNKVLDAVRAR